MLQHPHQARQAHAPANLKELIEAHRLTVNGSQLLGPDGRPVRLTGSNIHWQCSGMHGADPQDMHQLLGSGANVVQLIFLWDDTGHPSPQSDRMTKAAPYVKASCLHHLQWAVTRLSHKSPMLGCGPSSQYTRNAAQAGNQPIVPSKMHYYKI